MITTSVNRVKAGGFWCDDADAQTEAAMKVLGVDFDDEVPLNKVLPILGLGNTLLALGAPHPRYKVQAQSVLDHYAKTLVFRLMQRLAAMQVNTTLSREIRAILDPTRQSLRGLLLHYWRKEKERSGYPKYRAICEALIVLLADPVINPFHMRLIHAGKAYLDVAPEGELEYLTKELGTLLDA